MIEDKPSSLANRIARTATVDPTSLEEGRIGTFLEKEARTLPWLSRTITPRLDSFVSLNIAPSKLTFKLGAGGGLHLTRVEQA